MKQWVGLFLFFCVVAAQSQIAFAASDKPRDLFAEMGCEQLYWQKQYELALLICKKEAEQKHLKAQVYLGALYQFGLAVKKDYAAAVKWYRKAAKQGLSVAQFKLGIMYDSGQGVIQDSKKAAKWYRKAAEQGLAAAQFNLGNMYRNGLGVAQDYKEAEKWWYKAAKQGVAGAQYNLGRIFLQEEIGVNLSEALKWFSMSAKQGTQRAKDAIFTMASIGFNEAVNYWNKQHPEKYLVGWGVENYTYFDSTQIRDTSNGKAVWVTSQNRNDSSQKGVLSTLVICDEYSVRTVSTTVYIGNTIQTFYPERVSFDVVRPGSTMSNVISKVCKIKGLTPIKKKSNPTISFGTAWPISGSYVVTNNHVVAGHKKFVLLRTDGEKIPAVVVIRDKANDLALLKVENVMKLPSALPLAWGSAHIGAKVFTIGYPHPTVMGAKPKLTDGTVSSTTGLGDDPRAYQISVPLQSGNSGGPLLNMNGEVVGIVTAKLRAAKMFKITGDLPQNVNYAVKASYLKALLGSVSPPIQNTRTLPANRASLEELAARIKDSVLIVVAE